MKFLVYHTFKKRITLITDGKLGKYISDAGTWASLSA
jgi:hypothetical protein